MARLRSRRQANGISRRDRIRTQAAIRSAMNCDSAWWQPMAYLVIISSCCLLSFIVMLVGFDESWFTRWLGPFEFLFATRITLAIVAALFIIFINCWTFYRLAQGREGNRLRCLSEFSNRIAIPAALVTFILTLRLFRAWGPFHDALWTWDTIAFAGWQLMVLPVIAIGTVATLMSSPYGNRKIDRYPKV